jgi:hypothetical protein
MLLLSLHLAGLFDQMLRELEIRQKETKLTRVITKRDFYEEREG